ncbi:molybdopterin converting factor subunit 1 [Reichenbachiella sp. 5M10]|uniref:molybdopterin converting factor subunit 1 n=1 Tax=Reichenbachiella sp. 5M10 TaxID=1889772 RepID=UPI000C14DED0|nr:molybdopterin converting factor subunit 1 [Reichenbachiella sp. 5M10]PIB34601.1 molybdopterin converting factor subunit 1 [Reichenbachiella sp. 5M10]
MRVSVLAFGIARDILGTRTLDLDLATGQTVGTVVAELMQRYNDLAKLSSMLVAVNESYVPDDYVVKEGDELAIIPPVSGG